MVEHLKFLVLLKAKAIKIIVSIKISQRYINADPVNFVFVWVPVPGIRR